MDNVLKSLQQVVECQVCREPYSTLKPPKCLACGHTLCAECGQKCCGNEFVVACPICRTRLMIPCFDRLPNNFAVMEVVELRDRLNKVVTDVEDYDQQLTEWQETGAQIYREASLILDATRQELSDARKSLQKLRKKRKTVTFDEASIRSIDDQLGKAPRSPAVKSTAVNQLASRKAERKTALESGGRGDNDEGDTTRDGRQRLSQAVLAKLKTAAQRTKAVIPKRCPSAIAMVVIGIVVWLFLCILFC